MKKLNARIFIALLLTMVMLVFAGCQQAAPKEEPKKEEPKNVAVKDVILATTTSTQDSGLLDVLQPEFEKQTGYTLKIIAVGTGAALAMGEKGEADVLLVHAPASEKALVDSGVGLNYSLVMHNDFILVGPENDPAGIKEAKTTAEAMKKIYDKGAIFVSRGDDSGTHKKELEIWKEAGLDPKGQQWYQEAGSGMGQTLNIASEKQGYTLADRATYLAQKNNIKLAILLQGDKSLLNIYHVMNVNPEKFSKVNAEGGKAFVDFMIAKETQEMIGKFGVDKYGEPLFFPDAGK
ncbi:substrate-binding domain-containing protein [Desulforamulus ruminis]|uniref:Extracellular solute-binding protein n=1 Tax=Desulforamulus ruminis (strain ATCC 23193 / DSM 2154 / NCIMB 8452 / DL) TaxID=696281 RepID=F6DS43_DESRL|nr:substrate-binding domain-containing protein [Desulforamulus ruminis]AEG58805.1 extracellular solute-binding protein [Desulforamulus ruminis DSM 2154]